jgi:protein TonB
MSDPKRPSAHDSSHERLGSLGFLLEERGGSGRGLRLGVLVAILVHAGLFAVSFPVAESEAQEEPIDLGPPIELVDFVFSPPERPPVPEIPLAAPTHPVPGPPEAPVAVPIRRIPEPPRQAAPEVEPTGWVPGPPPAPTPKPAPEILVVGGDIAPPKIIRRITPTYTEAARRARIQGPVILELIIDTEGRVTNLTVLRGLPAGLTESATTAVSRWRFEPSTLSGRPVAVRYNLTVWFRLQ